MTPNPDPQPQPFCMYCDLAIRKTRDATRNEWEHMDGFSFCKDGQHWAWPRTMNPDPQGGESNMEATVEQRWTTDGDMSWCIIHGDKIISFGEPGGKKICERWVSEPDGFNHCPQFTLKEPPKAEGATTQPTPAAAEARTWGRIVVPGRGDIIGVRTLGSGQREFLMHNEALCHPYYVALDGSSVAQPVPSADERVGCKHGVHGAFICLECEKGKPLPVPSAGSKPQEERSWIVSAKAPHRDYLREVEHELWQVGSKFCEVRVEPTSQPVVDGGGLPPQLYSALDRLRKNAQHIFDARPVRDWAETLSEADAALEAYRLSPEGSSRS